MGSDIRHPIVADSDALIAVANTSLWSLITTTLNITTTNVCIQELKRHVREKSEYASEGTREQWVHTGSMAALEPFEDEETDSFSVVSCVPRPHGEDAGEESLRREIEQHPRTYRFAILMDKEGRYSIDRVFDQQDIQGRAIAPPFLLYLTKRNGVSTRDAFCKACGEMLEGEGWTGYKAIQAAWEAIPVDCSDVLDDRLLP